MVLICRLREIMINKKAERYSDSNMSPERCNTKKKEKSHSDSDMSPPRPSKIRKKSYHMHGDMLKNKDTGRAKTDFIPSKINHNFDHHYKERKKTCNSDELDTDPSRTKKLKYENKYKYRESEKEYHYKHGKSYGRSVSNQGREDSFRHRDIEKRKTERSPSHSRRKYDDRESTEKTYKSTRSNRTEAKKDSDSDLSPSRNKTLPEMKRVKSISRAKEQEKMQDGKKSGLQVAENLKEELKRFKANEDKMFKKVYGGEHIHLV
ncbi:uncharacterized protein isoform X3 [Rhodnius prolixus]|uniref:uncharacterized protein isoform X3 n=1 Tax=Rhodnius prolixus TaxID=13249 RepID=UPI003D18EFAB